METQDLIKREDGVRVSDWVLGLYKDEACPYKVVRACKNGNATEWEEADGFGSNFDTFPIKAPDEWREIAWE